VFALVALSLGVVVAACSPAPSSSTEPANDGLVLDGLFVATADEIATLDLDDRPLQTTLPSMEWKNMNSVKLGTLEARLTGVDYDDIDQDSLHNTFYVADEIEGPWYFTLRQELRNALTKMTVDQTESVARDWMTTDEWQGQYPSGITDADVAEVVGLLLRLAELASTATSRDATVFVVQGP
jgi:hypothetical protein